MSCVLAVLIPMGSNAEAEGGANRAVTNKRGFDGAVRKSVRNSIGQAPEFSRPTR